MVIEILHATEVLESLRNSTLGRYLSQLTCVPALYPSVSHSINDLSCCYFPLMLAFILNMPKSAYIRVNTQSEKVILLKLLKSRVNKYIIYLQKCLNKEINNLLTTLV
jgi:hypothetical protein